MAADELMEVDNWVRERVLGSGGFGEVTLWRHKTQDTMIALKKCRTGTDAILTKKHKERWSKEVEIMQRLNHPNVVKAVVVPPELAVLRSELPLMCMEYCSKGDLRQVLNRSENCCGLKEGDVRCLVGDVKSAVQYLHSMKITHRDLKPENIVLQHNSHRIVYKLIDLGYAKELDQSSICTSFVGTLQYLAPELFMSKTYNYSVDYWSLGLVSHEVITGVRPFLPSMTPAAWMKHVREKSSDDICAYQAPDGSIVFSKELFPQNHISTCLRYHVERWLKLVLEWDAAKRGRVLNAKNEPEIMAFKLIEDILSKKIVNLFLVPKYQHLSYEVDESTAVSTLQRWIERDTGVPVKEQELLLPSGRPFNPAEQACQCWVPLDAGKQGVMGYVFRRGAVGVEEVTPCIPQMVEKMMEEPRSPMEYVHQKRAWSHAVFFLQQEMQLYHTFLQAYKVKMLHVLTNNSDLNKQARAVLSQLQQVQAQHRLCLDSLNFDKEQAKVAALPTEQVAAWNRKCDVITRRLSKLKEAVEQLEHKCDVVNGKTIELQRSSPMKLRDHEVLASLYEAGLKCYDGLRRRPKESRMQRVDSVEMVKVVYNCLKQRDKLLRDEDCSNHFRQVVGVQSEVEQLDSPLSMSLQVISDVQSDLRKMQLDRQCDIWRQMIPERCNGYTVPVATTKPEVPPHAAPRERTPVTLSASLNNLRLADTPEPDSVTQQLDTSTMIQDNIALRYATQDMMNWSYQQYRQFMSEDQSCDWTFLNNQD